VLADGELGALFHVGTGEPGARSQDARLTRTLSIDRHDVGQELGDLAFGRC
jgi:hypothetical protein